MSTTITIPVHDYGADSLEREIQASADRALIQRADETRLSPEDRQ